jgi:SulP family sulfate permease
LLRRDVAAGLTVASVALPQAMAYALLAGIPPVYGLYTAIVMTALASLFGSSSYLINGPTNAISLIVFGTVAGVGVGPDDPARLGLVGLLAVLVGLLQLAIALCRLGHLARHVSEEVVLGFMAGAGVLVALTQFPNLLGLHPVGTREHHVLHRLWLTCVRGGPADLRALAIGLTTLSLVAALHRLSARLKVKLPELLLSLVLISLVVWLFDPSPAGSRIGRLHVESSFPTLHLPAVSADGVRQIGWGALSIALLGLVEALAIGRSLAARSGEPLDCNRQCLAEGLANLGGGLFQCMPGSGSLTRSAINYHAGAATRLSGVFSAAAVAAALWLFAPLARFVPQPALAGVLLWTAGRIVDRRRLWSCLRASRPDAVVALATAFAAVFLSIEFSVLIGVSLSLSFRALRRCSRAPWWQAWFPPGAGAARTTEIQGPHQPERCPRGPGPDPCPPALRSG